MVEHDLQAVRQQWDAEAVSFDDEPDHGLRNPEVRQAWVDLLRRWLPSAPATVLDLGCGTGSLSVLLAEQGYGVTGVDLSPEMLLWAKRKAEAAGVGRDTQFRLMDVAHPVLSQRFDVLLCRHVLWALPEPTRVLERWAALLNPSGRLVLVEGLWNTGAGLTAGTVTAALPAALQCVGVEKLSSCAALWGKAVEDERYVVVADLVKGPIAAALS